MEDRRWERVPVEMQAELFVGADTLSREARVVDLSWNGARIRAKGMLLKRRDSVDVVLIGNDNRHRRSARVVWVESVELDTVEAGLQFLQPLGAKA